MKVLVTGGAGFIGRNLVEKLAKNHQVLVIDNLSTGRIRFLKDLNVEYINQDISSSEFVNNSKLKEIDRIYHLAADIDNRSSWAHPNRPLQINMQGTLNVGLLAKNFEIPEIVYASSATIYGEHLSAPYFETDENSRQTSLYGATKYAAEGILSAFSFHFDIKVANFRFGNVLGPFCTHGHLYDFVGQLRQSQKELKVLGNGYQTKTYVHVSDVIEALTSTDLVDPFEVYNLSRSDFSTVKDSINWLREELELEFDIVYEEKESGWRGDNPRLYLDTSKIMRTGWRPKFSIEKAVKDTVRWLWDNQWVYGSI